jgi:enterochelin esterase family protein
VSELILDPDLRALVEACEAEAARDRTGRALVNSYLGQLRAVAQHPPVISGDTATFLYLGLPDTRVRVALAGEWNGWDPAAWMTPAGRSGLFWRVEHFDPAARVEYQFWVNERRKPDLLNPHRVVSVDRSVQKSALLMPEYRPPRDGTPRLGVPAGRVEEHTLHSPSLRQARTLFIYLPPGYRPDQAGGYPVVLFHDGGDYVRHAHAPTVLDNAIADGAIPPLIGVFAPPVDRMLEYAESPDPYVRFCAEELVAFVRERYPVAADPRRWATMGASLGGWVAVYLAWKCPQVFGWALPRSGAFSRNADELIGWIEEEDPVPVGFHCVAGLYERFVRGYNGGADGDFTDGQRRFVAMLERSGYEVAAAEYPAGHDWTFWSAHIRDGIAWALAR